MKNREPVYYGDYLQLDKILDAQQLESGKYGAQAHDENLFIIIHQTYELWFKQILIEINSIRDIFEKGYVPENTVSTAVSRINRVTEIFKILVDQIRIIETMTPLDFMEFRDFLLPASGFQSLQFRLLEEALGLKYEFRSDVEKGFFDARLKEKDRKVLREQSQRTSLFELVEAWLERMPFSHFQNYDFWAEYQTAVGKVLDQDKKTIEQNSALTEKQMAFELKNLELTRSNFDNLFIDEKYQSLLDSKSRRLSRKATLSALFIHLFREEPALAMPFQLLDSIVEVDEMLTTWRYRHAIMAQRILGTRIGTGGSSGHQYLKNTAESCRVFLDFFNLPTFLISKKDLPELPQELKRELGFKFDK